MKIGVPKEIKPQEHRIGLTPESVKTLISEGHEVLVENNGYYNNRTLKVNGYAYVTDPKVASNQLTVHFPTTLFGYTLFNQGGSYNVWSVDYNKFSLVFCF